MKNCFVIAGDITVVFLKTCDDVSYEAIIDTDDLPRVMELTASWRAYKHPYRRVRVTGGKKGLQGWLIDAPVGMQIDHINRNALDNRRSNLRICTPTENYRNRSTHSNNTSGTTGVIKNQGKWVVMIGTGGKNKYLGTFRNIEDAIAVRKEAEIKYFGDFRPMDKDDLTSIKC